MCLSLPCRLRCICFLLLQQSRYSADEMSSLDQIRTQFESLHDEGMADAGAAGAGMMGGAVESDGVLWPTDVVVEW